MMNDRLNDKRSEVALLLTLMIICLAIVPYIPTQASEGERIEISRAEDLITLAKECGLDSRSEGITVVLTENINLAGSGFENIPYFNGRFEGGGHSITGYTYSGDGYVTGFFRYIGPDAVVEDLTIKGYIVAKGDQQITGGLCGINEGLIKSSGFEGHVEGKSVTGGICGVNESSGRLVGCSNSGNILGYYYTGGIAGKNYGVISSCKNYGAINESREWVETDDEMGDNFLSELSGDITNVRVLSGVDTGGIAGLSVGIISRCNNEGTVGYAHTGYNVGGIAGRQSGRISYCNNYGQVNGRKDVGGIVGQMEPYLESNEKSSIMDDIRTLHDQIDNLLDDFDRGNGMLSDDMRRLENQSGTTLSICETMEDQAENFANENIDVLNDGLERVDEVIDRLPQVSDHVNSMLDSLYDITVDLQKLNTDIDVPDSIPDGERQQVKNAVEEINKDADVLNNQATQIKNTSEELGKLVSGNDAEIRIPDESKREEILTLAAELASELADATSTASKVISNLSTVVSIYGKYTEQAARNIKTDGDKMLQHTQTLISEAKAAQNGFDGILDYLQDKEALRLIGIDSIWSTNVDNLSSTLKSMIDTLSAINTDAEAYTQTINDDLREINDQVLKIAQHMQDTAEHIEENGTEYVYEDVSEEDIQNALLGKVNTCVNRGIIRGNINVGGIAGSMSIDTDDPEENAAGKVEFYFGATYTTQNIITDCDNRGFISAKGDGVGGIVGYMKHGTVNDCGAYGYVESDGGNYVGGVAGESLSIVRNCYVLCSISGAEYVGGVTGFGTTVSGCYSMPIIDATDGKNGMIAGGVSKEEESNLPHLASVSDNYFVGETGEGIDGISYAGVAERISYAEILRLDELPGDFRHLTVTFKTEDEILGEQQLDYGERLSALVYPDIPEKDGYYAVWPEVPSDQTLESNMVLEAEYVEIIRTLESVETTEYTGEEENKGLLEMITGLFSGKEETTIPDEVAEAFIVSEKANGYLSDTFDDGAVLHVTVTDTPSFCEEINDTTKEIIYKVELVDSGKSETDVLTLRLYAPVSDEYEVYVYDGSNWQQTEYLVRGAYAEVSMNGISGIYCIAEGKDGTTVVYALVVVTTLVVIVLGVIMVNTKRKRKSKKAETKSETKTETETKKETEMETEAPAQDHSERED